MKRRIEVKPKSQERCPWCGKEPILVVRDRLAMHVNPGNIRCMGSGMMFQDIWRKKDGVK
jgi:hypothetical protein